jgi:hypothetical protein
MPADSAEIHVEVWVVPLTELRSPCGGSLITDWLSDALFSLHIT